jgi:hypothetical protein
MLSLQNFENNWVIGIDFIAYVFILEIGSYDSSIFYWLHGKHTHNVCHVVSPTVLYCYQHPHGKLHFANISHRVFGANFCVCRASRQIRLELEPIPRLKSAGLFVWHQNTKRTPDLTLIALSLARALHFRQISVKCQRVLRREPVCSTAATRTEPATRLSPDAKENVRVS